MFKLSNKMMLTGGVAVALGMVGAAYAAVPLYNLFCAVTGYGGTTQVGGGEDVSVIDRTVNVRFDGSVSRGIPLKFEAAETREGLKVGERALAFYKVTNQADYPVDVTATYNVTPYKAGPYFVKLECFCFTAQRFEPGQTQELAVLYYVDPEMDDEGTLDDVRTITLSYTFFEQKTDGESVAAADAATSPASGG